MTPCLPSLPVFLVRTFAARTRGTNRVGAQHGTPSGGEDVRAAVFSTTTHDSAYDIHTRPSLLLRYLYLPHGPHTVAAVGRSFTSPSLRYVPPFISRKIPYALSRVAWDIAGLWWRATTTCNSYLPHATSTHHPHHLHPGRGGEGDLRRTASCTSHTFPCSAGITCTCVASLL